MVEWNPAAYNRFADQRSLPFLDLVELLPAGIGGRLLDLGCGDGRLTRIAAQRAASVEVVGVDSSASMHAAAVAGVDAVPTRWVHGDLLDWLDGDETWDLVLSNAALQFVDDHDAVFPRLLDRVAPGGWFAVHIPFNHVARSHLLMEEAASSPALEGAFGDFVMRWPQAPPELYDGWIRDAGFRFVSVQLRTYRHALEGAAGIVAWMRSGGLQPWLDALAPNKHEMFLADYTDLINRAYPPFAGDTRLLDYARVLMVGQRPPR